MMSGGLPCSKMETRTNATIHQERGIVVRILVADDQSDVRSALTLLLEQQPAVQVIAEATDVVGVLMAVETYLPELVLLDWELPGGPAAGLVRMLRSQWPQLRVIALSSLPEARTAALRAGVDAFVGKGDPPEVLLEALGKVDYDRIP